jgi:Ca2+-binding RTX toxin-like protein
VVRVATGATLTGGDTDNLLIGGAGDDALDGGGGNDVLNGKAGANTLAGGQGDDTFFVGGIGDVVDEAANGGHDRVLSAVSYQLSAGSEVEVLRTDDPTGVGAISLMGNEFGQTMQGNAGTNGLNGLGGADVMQGLGGDDTYWVDNAADRTVEAAGGGFDRVLASVSYALQAGREIEVLRTTNPGGVTAIDLTGNEMAQTMQGNAGANRLDGMAGNDVLQGLGGPDTFVFADGYDVDTAADYQAGVDQFDLTGVAGLDSYADLQALMNQVGANVVINFGGGDVLRILNITVATLDANPGDFVV